MTNDHAAPGAGLGIRPPAYRLPDATRVGSIRLAVSDLRRSIDYYERVLGLDSRDTSDGGASLGPRGDRAFLRLETNPGLGPARPGALGLYHFAIRVPDRAALGRFAEHVTGLGVPVGAADHFVSEAIYLRDPDGLGIEIYVDRPRETWRQRGRELVMTTDPLDVSGLVAATAGKTWTGMPPGTTIGHMHLHVGGLDEAEDFYHSALGFDKTVWSYPGALFLAVGGYHHHLGTNVWSSAPAAREDEARLIEWQLVVPSAADAAAAATSMRFAGHTVDAARAGWVAADPWGTRLRIVGEEVAGEEVVGEEAASEES